MGKRKNRFKRPNPPMSVTGILHLKNSFVSPSEEEGLLHTVGGLLEPAALVLAPNYGYGISASAVLNNEAKTKVSDPFPHLDEVSHEKSVNELIIKHKQLDEETALKNKEKNPDDLTVAELVRSIGGAKDKPFERRDIVEDRDPAKTSKNGESEGNGNEEEDEEDVQINEEEADEFYASIGMKNPYQIPNEKSDDNFNKEKSNGISDITIIKEYPVQEKIPQQNKDPSTVVPENIPDSIKNFYTTYTKYYHSVQHDPYGQDIVEFGPQIQQQQDEVEDEDYAILELAKAAQKARRKMEAELRAHKEASKKVEAESYDPLPMEAVDTAETEEQLGITNNTTLEQYWGYVREDPHDFNRWSFLIHHSEGMKNLNEIRKVYSAFLPLFPYCFGYWKRYAEIEKTYHYVHRALSILLRGLDFIPLSVDLWLSYITLYCEINAHHKNYKQLVRDQYEKALNIVGLEFRSDSLWDAFIEWEINNKNVKKACSLYRRLIQVPTRLYNRHWDNFKALIRDHHPRDLLQKEEYEKLRKKGCRILKFKYKEEPEVEPGEIISKTSKPEDKLMTWVKESILVKIEKAHEKCENEVDKRWDYEDKIKRPYFHTKPLDNNQLQNWEEYLTYEITEKKHDRIVLLFERCLIACAQYERLWCKYARYLELYHRNNSSSNDNNMISVHFQRSQINVEELISNKETMNEEEIIEDAKTVINDIIKRIEFEEHEELIDISSLLDSCVKYIVKNEYKLDERDNDKNVLLKDFKKFDLEEKPNINVSELEKLIKISQDNLSGHSDTDIYILSECPPKLKSCYQSESTPMDFSPLLFVPNFPQAKYIWQEVVRDVYKRASIVHCPKKPSIRLQWAAFEEELENINEARNLILHVLEWYPNHLQGKLQLLELERRNKNNEKVVEHYEKFLKQASAKKEEFSMISMKYARFLYKEFGKSDKALVVLRKALKKDRGNPRLYSFVFDICYDKYASDNKGAYAALELALQSKELNEEQKVPFIKKKVLFLQEHGDLKRYRNALDQLYEVEERVNREREKEKKFEALEYQIKLQNYYEQINQQMQPFPVPTIESVQQTKTPIQFEVINEEAELENKIKKRIEVPPTPELLVLGSEYGYGSKHPDFKLAEQMAHKEYEKLETRGYPAELKDKEGDVIGVNARKRKLDADQREKEIPLYIIPPKGAYLQSHLGGPNRGDNPPVPGDKRPRIELEAPVPLDTLVISGNSPCVNVPDWFLKEGGELCLSESIKGFSIIRYWPHFFSESGNKKMFRSMRRSVKWHQKQYLSVGRWRHVPRLVSWLGPCNYSKSGMAMKTNEDWPPEILDLLHRINQLTQHEFNSCLLNLYRSGHDSYGWHTDAQAALGSNPPIASISLGALRIFELKRRGQSQNFIRFPLFPGSLLLMEGATQEDWVHQIPRDPTIREERINLTFRIMHCIEDLDEDGNLRECEREERNKDQKKSDEKDKKKDENDKNKNSVPKIVFIKEGQGSEKGDKDETKDKSTNESPKSSSSKLADESKKETPKEKEPPPNKIIFHKKDSSTSTSNKTNIPTAAVNKSNNNGDSKKSNK